MIKSKRDPFGFRALATTQLLARRKALYEIVNNAKQAPEDRYYAKALAEEASWELQQRAQDASDLHERIEAGEAGDIKASRFTNFVGLMPRPLKKKAAYPQLEKYRRHPHVTDENTLVEAT